MEQSVRSGYAEDASYLIRAFEAISSPELLSPVSDFIPNSKCRVIEVGAGTGRDAAWLASKGHDVLAVEPVVELREAGKSLHPSPKVKWLDDSLPLLECVLKRKDIFDLALLISVWQHVRKEDKLAALKSLRSVLNNGANLIISVRNGPGAIKRKCYPISANETVELAQLCGFKLLLSRNAESVQSSNKKAKVTWTWLVFTTV